MKRANTNAARRALLLFAAAVALAPAATGLQKPFPQPAGGAPPAQQAALGRLLFFDPLLSHNRARSCAHCHQPARAFSDGRARAQGANGAPLPRNTPTLIGAAFKRRFMWDRRAPSLEAQALLPLFHPQELGITPAQLLRRLRANAEYRRLFAAAFAGEGAAAPVTVQNTARALAAYVRTLARHESRFDAYARGARTALTPAERRGLTLFRSLNTRCFECHRPPTFGAPLALGIGVPSGDAGVAGAGGTPAQFGFFGVPSLRNAARTAPYMHDGSLATLEEVVDFYREGGGRAHGVPAERINGHIRAFEISDAEARDLVAFLHSLNDVEPPEQIYPPPATVPSGLPVLAGLPAAEAD